MEWLEKDAKIIANIPKKDIIFGKEEREHYNNQTKCWICEKEFNDDKNVKVRDHCHFTDRYRGAAHNLCNVKYKKPDFIPVVVYNLAGYDSHLFIKELGWAMSESLPTHGFKWMNKNELETWEKHSCVLEVDLVYPKNLHDLHNDYPLAPERIKVNKVDKLIPNLWNKKNYVIHYENLKQYLSLGLKLTHIHRGIRFEEGQWLKKYIDLNTNLRTTATNEFKKDFFKLMNSSVFGKTMENIRKRVDVKLVNNRKKS